ncbi:hypothetical protein ACWKT1_28735 [Bacillus cereus]
MSTIAAMHDLYEKIDGLASSIPEAKELIKKKEKRDNYEKFMVEQAASISILTVEENNTYLFKH